MKLGQIVGLLLATLFFLWLLGAALRGAIEGTRGWQIAVCVLAVCALASAAFFLESFNGH